MSELDRTAMVARRASIGSTVSAYKVPTDAPESDGTYAWDHTTLVVVEASAGGRTGLGYSYADTATAALIRDLLAAIVRGRDAMAVPGDLVGNGRRHPQSRAAGGRLDGDLGRRLALWDLKAKLLDLPLVTLLGAVRDAAPVYGSGGFTSYSIGQLQEQLGGWVAAGIPRVKMKIGRHPAEDLSRVRPPARPSAPRPSCSSTPTAPTAASRPWPRPNGSPNWG